MVFAIGSPTAHAEEPVPKLEYETRPVYVALIPFGAGQFQNRQVGKGIFFLATQVATASASLGVFAYLRTKYERGLVPVQDAESARRLQLVQVGAGWAFVGLAAWGVVDALLHHRSPVVVKPMAGPDRLGLALSF